jgi:hypothetical protein
MQVSDTFHPVVFWKSHESSFLDYLQNICFSLVFCASSVQINDVIGDGKDQKYIQNFGQNTWRKDTTWKT